MKRPLDTLTEWREWDQTTDYTAVQEPTEELAKGTDLPRREWVALNRARSKVGRTAKNLHKWNLSESGECTCGEPTQSMEHLLRDCRLGPTWTDTDLLECNESAKTWVRHYSGKIWWWWWWWCNVWKTDVFHDMKFNYLVLLEFIKTWPY